MNILIANDGSDFGDAAVDYAPQIAGSIEGLRIKIVTVLEPAATLDIDLAIEDLDQLKNLHNPEFRVAGSIASRSAEALRQKLTGRDAVVTHEVLVGAPAQAIVEAAEEWPADLIIMGSHGRGFWKRALLGSVSDRVVHHAPCPVLIVRPAHNGPAQ